MATFEVWEAQRALGTVSGEFHRITGVYRTRIEQAKARLAKALEQQRRLQEEFDRLRYTLEAAFGVTFGQQVLSGQSKPVGGRVTFIQKTSQTELRRRLRELKAKLNERPG